MAEDLPRKMVANERRRYECSADECMNSVYIRGTCPPGPYQIDFTAAAADCTTECAAISAMEARAILIEKAKNLEGLEGSRGIPDREAAALKCCFRLYQKSSCGGGDDDSEWIMVGNDMKPLSMEHSQKDEGESGNDKMVAIESAVLEISISSVGIITTKLITNEGRPSSRLPTLHVTPSSSVGELLSVPCSSSVAFLSSLTSKREYSIVIPSVCWPITSMQLPTPSMMGMSVKRGI
eukprot:scaffold1602_cov160-Skeletonema_dohrnii-CCMP3373.AAC.2